MTVVLIKGENLDVDIDTYPERTTCEDGSSGTSQELPELWERGLK